MKIGGIEGGGTKFICAIGNEFGMILKEIVIPTTTPEETLDQAINFFKNNHIDKLGIACFGPLNININSNNYGCILDTPKKGWSNFNLVKYLKNNLNIPIVINTDVNAAALAEIKVGNSKNLTDILYITIGTGIGVGGISNGKIVNGICHSEMGHIYLNKHPNDSYLGCCPFHNNCLEGLASGKAIENRYKNNGENLQDNDEVWDLIGFYIGQALASLTFIFSPQRIIIGGGVIKQEKLLPIIKNYFIKFNNNYINNEYIKDIDSYIQITSLNDRAGLIGSLLL